MLLPFAVALIGSSILNLGFFLQKTQAAHLPKLNLRDLVSTFKDVLRCKKWLLGTCCTILGWSMFLLALGLAPLSVIAPLQNVGIILLAILSLKVLEERFHLYEWLGLALCLSGVMLLALNFNSNPVQNDYNNVNGFILIGGLVFIGIILHTLQNLYFPIKKGVSLSFISGLAAGLGAIFTKLIVISIDQTWLLVIFVALFLLAQLLSFLTLQASFAKERALVVVLIFNSISTLIPIVAGLYMFYESLLITQFVGIAFILVGSSLLFKFNNIDYTKT